MVTRKSSIPYPSSPPPPPPSWGPSQPHHNIDSSDIPPIPATGHRVVQDDSPYDDMGNPWLEQPGKTQNVERPDLPLSLKPRAGKAVPDESSALKSNNSAINTPRSSIDSQRSRDFWESSDEEDNAKEKGKKKTTTKDSVPPRSESTEELTIPSPLQIKRKPLATSPAQKQASSFEAAPHSQGFASNNPFRKESFAASQPPIDAAPWGGDDTDKGKGRETDAFPAAHFEHLTLENNASLDSTTVGSVQIPDDSAEWQRQEIPPMPQAPPPPIPIPQISSPFSEQPPLIPVSPKVDEALNPWTSHPGISATPSPIPFMPSQKQQTHSTEDLLDRGQKGDGRLSLGDELKALPNAAHTTLSQQSLLDEEPPPIKPPRPQPGHSEEQYDPPPGPPPSHRVERISEAASSDPPVKPPRPARVVKPLSDADIAEMKEQRNETYQIKHFNWFDHRSGNLRQSSMLTQNKNGPCPLLALVNALILGANDASQAALDDALRSREQVSLGLIIETLMDELLSSGVHLDGELPDMDELNRFLMKLRTGMNMNPRFVQSQVPPPNLMDARNSVLGMPTETPTKRPGGFEPTQDIQLYSAFGIMTVHGWLPDPSSDAIGAFQRSAPNYDDAQVIQFGEEELDYKLSQGGLTPQEQQLWEDIISIKRFFSTYPTQLTPYGLESIKQSMLPGSFEILFRNDHFSTIYKHPRDGNLYTLITDAGYADRDEVIWESLVDISGQHSEFFSGDFQSVSHHAVSADSSRQRSDRLTVDTDVAEPLSPQQQQEQHDADFAMALQLQEEEEQRVRQQRAGQSGPQESGRGRGRGNGGDGGGGRGGRGRGAGGIPIPLRGNNSSTENRPLIPPRNARSNLPPVNRPSDALDADAPPSYEEAARGEAYNPPLGSPLHPSASPVIGGPSPYASTSNPNLPETATSRDNDAPPPFRRPERRQSAYSENHERRGYGSRQSLGAGNSSSSVRMPGTYLHTGQGGHGQGYSNEGVARTRQGKNNDGDCTVM